MRWTSKDIADEAEISYRQIDHWIRQGWVKPRQATPGSGTSRDFTDEEVLFAIEMGRLVKLGFTPQLAHDTARTLQRDRVAVIDAHYYVVRVP